MSNDNCKPRVPRKPKIYTPKTIDTRAHMFNVGIAIDYCPDMAIWLGHIAHWTEKNLTTKNHIFDGAAWSFDTLDDLLVYFPYFSRRQLETIINNSVSEGLIQRGNYNATGYDRTSWYALTPKAYFYFQYLLSPKNVKTLITSISQICEMENTDLGNGNHRSVTTIPDTDPNTKPDTNKPYSPLKNSRAKKENLTLEEIYKNNPHGIPEDLLEEWRRLRKKTITQRVIDAFNNQLGEIAKHGITPIKAVTKMLEKQWQTVEVIYFEKEIAALKNGSTSSTSKGNGSDALSRVMAKYNQPQGKTYDEQGYLYE